MLGLLGLFVCFLTNKSNADDGFLGLGGGKAFSLCDEVEVGIGAFEMKLLLFLILRVHPHFL